MKNPIHHLVRKLLLFVLFACSLQPLLAQTSGTVTVYFDSDKSELTPASRKILQELLQRTDTLQGAEMTITGHTDSEGSDDYNDQLSDRRVQSVLTFLDENKQNSLPALVSKLPNGEKSPVASNSNKKGMSLNRRVEITWTAPVLNPKTIAQKKSDIADLYKTLQPKGTVYCINSERDTFLVCEKGTVIYFPANAFDGKLSKRCTEITVTEALDYSDMLLQNLSTDSPDGLLITGGMLNITGTDADGNPLKLKAGKELEIYFPTDSLLAEAGTYYGSRDSTHQQNMHWNGSNGSPDGTSGIGTPYDYWEKKRMVTTGCDECTFFFCRINRFPEAVAGTFDKSLREDNRKFRSCQRKMRKTGQKKQTYEVTEFGFSPMDEEKFLALYKEYMEKRGLKTMDEALQSMKREQDSLQAMRQGLDNLSYNVIRSNQLNAINCDYFPGKGGELMNVETGLGYSMDTDLKMVFKNIRAVMPAYPQNSEFYFTNVPKGEKVWVIGLRLDGTQAYLYLQEIVIGKDEIDVQFRAVTTEELKQALKVLN